MTTKLSATQHSVLKIAARYEDRAIRWPDRLKGGAIKKVADALISAGLARYEGDVLIATDEGLRAVGADPNKKSSTNGKQRKGTKQALVIDMLRRAQGATIALAQSNEETRYYLKGVYFDGQTMVATDGHILTASWGVTGNDLENRIYPVSKKAITALKHKNAEYAVFDGETLTVYGSRSGYYEPLYMEPCKEIDATFPDWRRVVPLENGKTCNGSFSLVNLDAVAKTAAILNCEPIHMAGADKDSPHIVRYGRADTFTVVAPMRNGGGFTRDDSTAPDWLYHESRGAIQAAVTKAA